MRVYVQVVLNNTFHTSGPEHIDCYDTTMEWWLTYEPHPMGTTQALAFSKSTSLGLRSPGFPISWSDMLSTLQDNTWLGSLQPHLAYRLEWSHLLTRTQGPGQWSHS